MGYFVRKTSFGLRPVTGTSDIEINDTDGYCLSPDEYVNIQQTIQPKEKNRTITAGKGTGRTGNIRLL